MPGLRQRIVAEGTANLCAPIELDVRRQPWPTLDADAVFMANTLHIMAWEGVESCFAGIAQVLAAPGAAGLALVADHAMPANNQLLIWRR